MQYGHINVGNYILNYKFQYQSFKLLLIKTGFDGSLEGYQNKYTTIANNFLQQGFSVLICDNSSNIKDKDSYLATIELANKLMKQNNIENFEIYYFGVSRGATQLLCFATLEDKLKQAILINPPLMINFNKQIAGFTRLKNLKIKIIIGDKDPSFSFLPLIKQAENDNLNIYEYQGADHQFRGLLTEFINLANDFYKA